MRRASGTVNSAARGAPIPTTPPPPGRSADGGGVAVGAAPIRSSGSRRTDPETSTSPLAAAQQTSQLTGLVGWVADVVSALGWLGVSALVALENVFPPIPSEVVLPFAGFVAGREDGSPLVMTIAATVGSVLGAVVLYELGRRVGQHRTRRFLCRLPLVEEDEVDRAIGWFHRHGNGSVFFGRFVPFVRSMVSLPAGAARMGRIRFLLLTAVGSAIWNTIWVYAGFLLGQQWQQVGQYSDWINYGLIAVTVGLVARFVWRRRDRLPGAA